MEVFVVTLLFSLLIFALLFLLLVWSISSDQFDDLSTPGERALWDDPPAQESGAKNVD